MITQTKFNMSAATLQRLDELLRKASYYYSIGNQNKFIIGLKNVKLQAMFKFSIGERKYLKSIENKYIKENDKKIKWGWCELYNEKLLDYMNKYGLLLPDKIDDTGTSY